MGSQEGVSLILLKVLGGREINSERRFGPRVVFY